MVQFKHEAERHMEWFVEACYKPDICGFGHNYGIFCL